MRFIAFLLCLTTFIQSGSQEFGQDNFQNRTAAATTPIEIKLKDNYITKTFELKIQYVLGIERPEKASLVFRVLSHRWRFLEESERQANLLIDGVIFSPSSKPNYASVVGEKLLEETLSYEVSLSEIEKIAKAANIDIRIGGVEGRIREKQLGKVKDFLNSLTRP
jgi:hypothetical protein